MKYIASWSKENIHNTSVSLSMKRKGLNELLKRKILLAYWKNTDTRNTWRLNCVKNMICYLQYMNLRKGADVGFVPMQKKKNYAI